MTGVSAEWVNDEFTSLRVTVQEGGTHRISLSGVIKRNANNSCTRFNNSSWSREAMADPILHATIDELSSNCSYTLLVEVVSIDLMEPVNDSVGVGEYMHIIFLPFLFYLVKQFL